MPRSRRDTIRQRRVSYEGIRLYTNGSTRIEFTLERSTRRTIGLTVFPGGAVRVRAPRKASEDAVMDLIAGREGWILTKQRELAGIPVARTDRFTSSSEIPFLGRYRTIEIGDPMADRSRIHLRSDRIIVDGATTPQEIHRVVYRWYRDAARRVFGHRTRALRRNPRIALLGQPKELNIRLMRRRWGSCFTDRRITLNPELCAAGIAEIDYVILHELCHFREHNHSPRFYRLLSDRMPDWQERRERLNRFVPAGYLRSP